MNMFEPNLGGDELDKSKMIVTRNFRLLEALHQTLISWFIAGQT